MSAPMRVGAATMAMVTCGLGAAAGAQDLALSSPDGRFSARVDRHGVALDGPDASRYLPGYPRPTAAYHRARTTTMRFDSSSELVALGGRCSGYSGITPVRRPSCAATFVRLYRTADGAQVRDLSVPWDEIFDAQEVVALAFDDATARLAVLVRYLWSDCSWNGDGLRLYVFDVHTGDRLHQRDLAQRAGRGPFGVGFVGDTIVFKRGAGPRARVRALPLPP